MQALHRSNNKNTLWRHSKNLRNRQTRLKEFFLNDGREKATDMNVDIQQPDEPLEGAAEVVDEMDPSQAAITAPDARLVLYAKLESIRNINYLNEV